MKRIEYRIERLPLQDEHEVRLMETVERLNELGRQGWHVASVDLTPHPSFQTAPVPVLLEREVEPNGVRA